MRKLLLASLVALLAVPSLRAQCVPDTTITNIVEPPAGSRFDTVNGTPIVILPVAQVGVAYNEVLQFKVPSDTTYLGISGTVDSVKLVQIMHLPPAFTLSCNPSNCVFPGGTFGCGALTGIPANNDSIELEVVVEYTVTIGAQSAPIRDTLENYYLVVKGGGPVGLNEEKAMSAPRVYPNPARDVLFIAGGLQHSGNVTLLITNLLGQQVKQQRLNRPKGTDLSINISDLKPGVYLYRLSSENGTFTGRFSIAR